MQPPPPQPPAPRQPASTTPRATTTFFHDFPRLSQEIQDEIWEAAVDIIPAVHAFKPVLPADARHREAPHGKWAGLVVSSPTWRQTLLQTCSSSRAAVLRNSPSVTTATDPILELIDFETDIVFLGSDQLDARYEPLFARAPHGTCPRFTALLQNTTRLAVPCDAFLGGNSCFYGLFDMVCRFEQLKVVYLVTENNGPLDGQREMFAGGDGRVYYEFKPSEAKINGAYVQARSVLGRVRSRWTWYADRYIIADLPLRPGTVCPWLKLDNDEKFKTMAWADAPGPVMVD